MGCIGSDYCALVRSALAKGRKIGKKDSASVIDEEQKPAPPQSRRAVARKASVFTLRGSEAATWGNERETETKTC